MDGGRRISVRQAALGAAATVALLTGVADAKPWAKWAPAPLASDSTYAAMLARPADSLTASQLMWLAVQRDWRAQRDEEAQSAAAYTEFGRWHRARRTDARFAALVSRPYAALADSERAWLVAESAAQRADRGSQPGAKSSAVVGIVLLAGLAGALAAYWLLASAFGHAHWP
jgi:hypothetical protein